MSKELPNIGALKREQSELSDFIVRRQETHDRIGTGDIKLGSSMEATLKVAKARKTVRTSLDRLKTEQETVNRQLTGYNEAKNYLSHLSTKRTMLDQLSELAADDDLMQEAHKKHLEEFEVFSTLPDRNPTLKQGLDLIRREQEEKSGTKKTSVTDDKSKGSDTTPETKKSQ